MAFKLTTLATGLALAGLAGAALAQTPAAAPERITITGSSIKRIAAEGALPLQVITRAELDRQGIVNAEQLIATLTFNGNGLDNLASNADVVSGQARGNNGASSANLRGQGASSTLILLNGRRVAAHGLNGGVVDLNQIPMAAVERVEILKDGASSVYGTDAVGGVINFILRNNFQGLRVAASTDVTEAGGGDIHRATLAGGFGNLDTDGFNVVATLSMSDAKVLNGRDRDFVDSFQATRGLSPDTRGAPFATLFTVNTTAPNALTRPGGAGTPAANGTAPLIGGVATNGINVLDIPGGAGCASQPDMGPYEEVLWNAGAGARFGCAWDTGKSAVIQQPVKNTNLVTRGTFKLGSNHTLIGELLLGKSESAKRFSENQITSGAATATVRLTNNTVVPSPFANLLYPSTGAGYDRVFNALATAFPELEGNRGNGMAFRWRCLPCGQREIETETDTSRYLLGLEGLLPFGGWEYRTAFSQAKSESKSTLGGGYHYMQGFAELITSGVLNPFLLAGESQTQAAMAGLERVSARGVTLYGGEYTTTQTDFVATGPVFKLPAGEAMAAVGVDLRTEKYSFRGNNDAGFSSISNWVFNAPFDNINALSGVKRDVNAVFGELSLPLLKSLEVTLSVRHDKYDDFGDTTNPKVSLRFQPLESLAVRAAYSTGFRVPSFNQLYNGVTESPYTGAGVPDPLTCPTRVVSATTPGCAAITFNTFFGGVRNLQPEESEMANIGLVWQPTANLSATLDLWDIVRDGTIQDLGITGANGFIRNFELFQNRFIRNADGAITHIDTSWINAGETETRGLELSLRGNFDAVGARFAAGLDVSYLLKKRSRLVRGQPFGASEVGVFTRSGDLGIRWKHNAFVTYARGDWSATLRQRYSGKYAGYRAPGIANGNYLAAATDWDPVVKPYTLYDLGLSFSGIKNLTINAGIKNLLDKDPPFANSYDTNTGSGSSWEPRVADPRGRSFQLGLEYRFF